MIALALGLGLAGCVGDPRPASNSDFTRLWQRFSELPEHRALAVAGDPTLRWVAGASGGSATPAEAEREALAQCAVRRQRSRMQDPCRLYAADGEVVWAPPR